MQSHPTIHQQTDDQPVPEQQPSLKPEPRQFSITELGVLSYGVPFWPVWVNRLSGVPSQFLACPQPSEPFLSEGTVGWRRPRCYASTSL